VVPATVDPALFTALALAIGLVVGSFLNVVIHRLPKMLERAWEAECAELRGEPVQAGERFNLAVPASRCPHCGHAIRAWENIPVLSYLFLRGRCAHCQGSISPRYPIIELASGIVTAYAAWRFGYGLHTVALWVLAWTLIALTFIDVDTQLLPDNLTLPLLWLGLLCNSFGFFAPLRDAVWGAAGGYLFLWSVYWLFKLIRGKEGMGYGDFKLLGALGAWFGWQMLLPIILLSAVVGSVVGVSLVMTRRLHGSTPIPFGPYLAGAGFIVMFWGRPLQALLIPHT
jgi:leader peptidase (prepilin peptidase)/N-methyltransferase